MRWVWLFALVGFIATPAGASEIIDGIAAQVGGEIVLISEIDQVARPLEIQMRAEGAPESEVRRLRATVLDRLIDQRLVQIVVRRAELDATDAEVTDAIAAIAAENELSPDELRASVESQGLPFDAYTERIRGEIENAKVMNGIVASGVRIEDSDVRRAYEERYGDQPAEGAEVHLRHILVAFADDTPAAREAACRRVEEALGRVRGGEPFGDVARRVSQSGPERGGDIGWVHDSNLADWMRDAVTSLSPGETSEVLRTSFGCNLLELVERRSFEPMSFERAGPFLRNALFEIRLQEEYREFLDRIRSQTYIERKGVYAGAARATVPKSQPSDEETPPR